MRGCTVRNCLLAHLSLRHRKHSSTIGALVVCSVRCVGTAVTFLRWLCGPSPHTRLHHLGPLGEGSTAARQHYTVVTCAGWLSRRSPLVVPVQPSPAGMPRKLALRFSIWPFLLFACVSASAAHEKYSVGCLKPARRSQSVRPRMQGGALRAAQLS